MRPTRTSGSRISVASSGGLEPPSRKSVSALLHPKVEIALAALEQMFEMEVTKCKVEMHKWETEMKKGLSKSTNATAKVKMVPSFVTKLPSGQERGNYLALDLGGENLRIVNIKIGEPVRGEPSVEMNSLVYKMTDAVITGPGKKLFGHIAQCMSDFISKNKGLAKRPLPVGFTMVFPCKQSSVKEAELTTWRRGYKATDVIGNDIATMLNTAIAARKDPDMDAQVVAVVSDTVGMMVSGWFSHGRQCRMGLVIGRGSNACYMEKVKNVELIGTDEGEMCINMEWGAFGDDGILADFRNEYDKELDALSNNPGEMIFEKMTSSHHMGKLVCIVLCKLIKEHVLLQGRTPPDWCSNNYVVDSFIFDIENATSVLAVQNFLPDIGIQDANKNDCVVIQRVCKAVSQRSARLCASGLAAIAVRICTNERNTSGGTLLAKEQGKIKCGIDESLYNTPFCEEIKYMVNMLCKDHNIHFEFANAQDGPGKGVALVTALVNNLKTKK